MGVIFVLFFGKTKTCWCVWPKCMCAYGQLEYYSAVRLWLFVVYIGRANEDLLKWIGRTTTTLDKRTSFEWIPSNFNQLLLRSETMNTFCGSATSVLLFISVSAWWKIASASVIFGGDHNFVGSRWSIWTERLSAKKLSMGLIHPNVEEDAMLPVVRKRKWFYPNSSADSIENL